MGGWKRIDSNQPEIVQALRSVGAEWIPTSGDPNIGFDGIVLFRGHALICEIKDGAKPPSARKLTENEAKRKLQCELHNVPYLILLSVEQAIKSITELKKSNGAKAAEPIHKGANQVLLDTRRTLKSVVRMLDDQCPK